MPHIARSLCLSALAALPLSTHATLGVFEHGNGIQSMAMGGVA